MTSRAPSIDRALLASTRHRWLKVARIIPDAAELLGDKSFDRLRMRLFINRVQALARLGAIERVGWLFRTRHAAGDAIRYSEVRSAPTSCLTAGTSRPRLRRKRRRADRSRIFITRFHRMRHRL